MTCVVQKGVLFAIGAYACYTIAASLIKVTAVSFESIVFFRNFVGLCIFLPLFLKNKTQLKTSNFWLHCVRSLVSLATIYCSTYGIQRLKLADAILLEQSAPFFIPTILFLVKGEAISRRHLICICSGFLGVFFILAPSGHLDNFGTFAALGAGFLVAVSIILMKRLVKTEGTYGILFYFLLFSTVMSAMPMFGSQKVSLTFSTTNLLILIGLFFSFFQFFLTRALSFINPQVVGSYACFSVFFSFALGVLFFNEEITFFRFVGAILIIIAGFFTYRLESKRSKTC